MTTPIPIPEHDAHELAIFFANLNHQDMKEVLLAYCGRDPDGLLSVIRDVLGSPWRREALALMTGGKKIDAIKLCREYTGWGLKEAKDACEALI